MLKFKNKSSKMNFQIVLAIIGLVLSLAASVWSCPQVITCDQYGNEYPTPCDFAAAQRDNPDLEEAPCY